MELSFPHRIEYTDGRATLDEVIANLQAQKRLIEEGVRLLDHLIREMEVEKVEIRVVAVRDGSLFLEFVVLVYTSYQKDIQKLVAGNIEKMFGYDIPDNLEPLVTLTTLAVVYFVARYAYDAVRARKADDPPPMHIEGDYNTVINIVARDLEVPVSEVADALHETLPRNKRRALLKQVSRFLRPRKDGKVSPIEVSGFGKITPETIAEYPSDAEIEQIDDSRNLDIPSARLNIRATDKDKSTKWAAVIVGDQRFKKRLPMDLYPTINPEQIAKLDIVTGDVIVQGERTSDGKFRPRRIHLLSVKEPDTPNE